ncbi:hypothetical protein Tco_0635452 [Tanacetum coccineum]
MLRSPKENDRNEKWYYHYSSLRYQSKMLHNQEKNYENEKEGCRSLPREGHYPRREKEMGRETRSQDQKKEWDCQGKCLTFLHAF